MQDQDEYLNAFRGENAEPVDLNAAPEGETDTPAVAVVIDAEKAVDDAAEEAGLPQEEPAEAPMDGEVAEAPVEKTPEEIQREKSWEGRLKKREEELAAREAALTEAKPEAIGDEEIAEIQRRLGEDFGDEFVQMITKLAGYEAQKVAGSSIAGQLNPLAETVAQAIADVQQAFATQHFSAIAEAHGDFQEIVNSPDFQAYIDGLPEADKAQAIQVIQGGSPKQVIGLLNGYKASLSQQQLAAPAEEPDLEAAEGVRGSAPVALPGRVPVSDDDEYRSAWNSM